MTGIRRCRVVMANSPVGPQPRGASEGQGAERLLEVPGPFGRFQLIERIGAGGMAEVLRAEVRGPAGFRRELVIKRVLPRLGAQPRFTQMFVNEAKICALLNHHNIVQIFEFGEVEGSYFIAMESVLGFTLREALTLLRARSARMPVAAALEIVRALLGALDYAHNLVDWAGRQLDIVHRDISPSNVMLAQNGAVKVLDFGIARAADILGRPEAELEPATEQPSAPPAGEGSRVNGKIPYLAPEQLTRGAVVDHRADVFAVGCVLFELLTGRPLFRCQSDLAQKMALLRQPSPAPSAFNAEVPPAVDAIVARAVERRPDARYGSAVAMLADVESFLASRGSSDRAILRLVRSLDDRAGSSDRAGETFLTSSARVTRPVLVDPASNGAPSPRPPAPGAPARGSESPIARSSSSAGWPPGTATGTGTGKRTIGDSWRASGRFLGLVAVLALLLVAVGLRLHAHDADRTSGHACPVPAAVPGDLAPRSAAGQARLR